MPIPTPSKGEEQNAFRDRCMGNPTMVKEYPDQKQRAAICHSQWRKKPKKQEDNVTYEQDDEGRIFADPAPGGGQGVGKPKQGKGGRDKCKCTKCGHIQTHDRGTPCVKQKCSECGAAMAPVTSNERYMQEDDGRILEYDADELANLASAQEFAKLESIKDMMVFKPGTHNGTPFTDKHIDLIVENFKKLKEQIRPKLKITHKENQKTLAGLASYGDVLDVFTRVVKQGEKKIKAIFVKIANVPKQVKDWINDRRFPERSIELWPAIKVEGKIYKWVLRNVSLLGHEPPAVPGMEPIKVSNVEETFDELPENCMVATFEIEDEDCMLVMFEDEEESITV